MILFPFTLTSGLGVFKVIGTSLGVWKEREVKEEEKRAEVYLTDEELDAIYNYPLEGTEEHARDLFVLGCLSCQRFSDYSSPGIPLPCPISLPSLHCAHPTTHGLNSLRNKTVDTVH